MKAVRPTRRLPRSVGHRVFASYGMARGAPSSASSQDSSQLAYCGCRVGGVQDGGDHRDAGDLQANQRGCRTKVDSADGEHGQSDGHGYFPQQTHSEWRAELSLRFRVENWPEGDEVRATGHGGVRLLDGVSRDADTAP